VSTNGRVPAVQGGRGAAAAALDTRHCPLVSAQRLRPDRDSRQRCRNRCWETSRVGAHDLTALESK